MNIISYNVNGIRSAINKGLLEWLNQVSPDVVCLQEIKASIDQIPTKEIEKIGYKYQYYLPAIKKGYSGVAILSKTKPIKVEYGTGIDYMDIEGRNIRVDFDNISIMSLYMPSGTRTERLEFKFKYMDDFCKYTEQLLQTHPKLIICGDYNICHKPIDIHDPIRNAKVSGFLPQEREWLNNFINNSFIDSFRYLNPETTKYSWWSYRANSRNNNKGWRIDYNLVSKNLIEKIETAEILNDVVHSDHCPISVKIDL